jgi:hypothetical protein
LHFYAQDNNSDSNLKVYFANNSYVSGNPLTSPYCELIGVVESTDSYAYTVLNSSYYDLSFSTDTNGSVGSVGMSDNFSFIFASNSKDSVNKWDLFFADDNITILSEYHDFFNSTCSMTCPDKGVTWSYENGTIDSFLTYGHLQGIDRIMYKVYVQMNGTGIGDGYWSSVQVDVLDEVNIQPNYPNVITPNGTAPTVNYTVGDIINVSYSWLGDPNLDTCWLNITVHNYTDDSLVYYLQNRSITSAEYEVNNTWYYDWDTTGLTPNGPYYVNVTATDPYDLYHSSSQEGVFYINASTNNCPVSSGLTIANNSCCNQLNLTWNVTINDADGDNTNGSIELNDGQNTTWINQTNGTRTLSIVNLTCGLTYTVFLNFTDGNCSVNETYYFDTVACSVNLSDCVACFNDTNFTDSLENYLITNGYIKESDNVEISLDATFITLLLFALFFIIGYTQNKKSGGILMIFSGFVFFAFEYLVASSLSNIFVVLMSPIAILIILLGVRKWLYSPEGEKTKSEGN